MAPAFRLISRVMMVTCRSLTPRRSGTWGEEYNLFGARVADTKMAPLAVPASYNWLPPSDLPSGVLELADLFEVHARDLASGSRTVPSFEDALFMQRLLEQAAVSSASGHRITL